MLRRPEGFADYGRIKPAEAGVPERRLQPALGTGPGQVLNRYSDELRIGALVEERDQLCRILGKSVATAKAKPSTRVPATN
jgi:hypothetical protein